MFSVDQAEMMLAQARMLCDAGSSLVQAETVTRNAMGLLAPKGRVRRGKRAQLLISESALLLGRIYRGLGKLEQASVWLTRAWKMYNDLPGASSDPHIQTRLSECSNHLTLIVIEDLRIAARAVRTPLPELERQTAMLDRVPRHELNEHALEATQRWADYLRFQASDEDAVALLKRHSFLRRAEDMWDHNRSHRLMFQALVEMRTQQYDQAASHLDSAASLPITFTEPSLEVLWQEKMIELLTLTGSDGAETHEERANLLRRLTPDQDSS